MDKQRVEESGNPTDYPCIQKNNPKYQEKENNAGRPEHTGHGYQPLIDVISVRASGPVSEESISGSKGKYEREGS